MFIRITGKVIAKQEQAQRTSRMTKAHLESFDHRTARRPRINTDTTQEAFIRVKGSLEEHYINNLELNDTEIVRLMLLTQWALESGAGIGFTNIMDLLDRYDELKNKYPIEEDPFN